MNDASAAPLRMPVTAICSVPGRSGCWRSTAAACAARSRWRSSSASRHCSGAHTARTIRLGDYFDLIGGTSTGAIIAGALALGYRTAQVKDFYLRLAPFAFKRQRWRIPLLQAKFDARGLRHQIEEVVGDRLLSSPDLDHRLLHHHQAHGYRQPLDHIEQPARAVSGKTARIAYRQQALSARQPGARQYRGAAFFRSGAVADQPDQTMLPDVDGQAAQHAIAGGALCTR